MKFIEIRHPGLGVTSKIPESALPTFQAKGWYDATLPEPIDLDELTLTELRQVADTYAIEIPRSVRLKADICAFLSDALDHERSASS